VTKVGVVCRAARFAMCACAACATLAAAQTPAKSPAKPLAPTSAKSYRIGVLSQGNPPSNEVPGADYRQGLKDLGYVNGANVSVEFRYGSGSADKLPELAVELVKMNVDVIVTVGDSAAFTAKKVTASIPVVATEFGVDPVKTGLVTSLARPAGNVTGLSSISDELWSKRLGLLRELVPRLARVTAFWNSGCRPWRRCASTSRPVRSCRSARSSRRTADGRRSTPTRLSRARNPRTFRSSGRRISRSS